MEYRLATHSTTDAFINTGIASREVCDAIQDEQNEDFKRIWSRLHPDIALVCLCGNHDLGNRPTPRSISRFRAAYGDEYLAFWVNGTYNICVNNVLFVDPSGGKRIFKTQMKWLEERLRYAQDYHAKQVYGEIFVKWMNLVGHVAALSTKTIFAMRTLLSQCLDTIPGSCTTKKKSQSLSLEPHPTHKSGRRPQVLATRPFQTRTSPCPKSIDLKRWSSLRSTMLTPASVAIFIRI